MGNCFSKIESLTRKNCYHVKMVHHTLCFSSVRLLFCMLVVTMRMNVHTVAFELSQDFLKDKRKLQK